MRKTSYRAGTPAWVDLSTPDIDATTAFYGALFGWRATETSEDYGGYIRYELDGEAVAGGADRFVSKPFDPDDLRAVVAELGEAQ